MGRPPLPLLPLPRVLAAATLLAAALPASALYKVVGPDGKVTYTDRPPAATGGTTPSRVTSIAPSGNAVPAGSIATLPAELRQAVARYPVTLYVIANCAPCDSARALLRQRGIPYTEKIVASEDDAAALQRIAGTRDAPTLTIGAQPLRGLVTETWQAYLDSAGYPRESRLPSDWRFPAATPVVERRDAAAGAASRPGTGAEPDVTPPAPAPGGIRF